MNNHQKKNGKISRRNFIAGNLTLAAGVSVASPFSFLGLINDETPLRVGIIGTGSRGAGLAKLIQDIPQLETVALCDTLPFRLQSAMPLGTKGTKAYQDYRALLEDPRVEAVIIATPFGTHADIAMQAVEAEKHIYCEKTMSYGIAPTRKLVDKVQSSSIIFQTGHQYHSSRLYRRIIELIHEGYIGEVSLIASQWNRNGDWRRPVPDPKWEKEVNWRMYREMSGGLTAELCAHQIDFTNWLLDAVPIKVSGSGGVDHWKDGRETYDNVHLLTTYENGVKATYTSLTTNAKGGYKISIHGKKGTIVLNAETAYFYLEKREVAKLGTVDGVSGATLKAWQEGEGVPIQINHKNPTIQALLDFAENVKMKKTPISNVVTGAKASVVVQMALNAMDNNRVEYWKDEYNF